jgi:hypothetical protein
MIVNDKSAAMAMESVVTYFRSRLCVSDRTKKIYRSRQNARHTVQIQSGFLQVRKLIVHSCSRRSADGKHGVLQ